MNKKMRAKFLTFSLMFAISLIPQWSMGQEPDSKPTGGVSNCVSCQMERGKRLHSKTKTEKDLQSLRDEIKADWSKSPAIQAYSKSAKVKKMIDYAIRHANGNFNDGRCYKYVLNAMLAAQFLTPSQRERKNGKNKARQAVEEGQLPGFVNLMNIPRFANRLRGGPEFAPDGAILVYSHGRRPGHIEFKTGCFPHLYVSSFKHHRSVVGDILNGQSGRNYTLIGVMVQASKDDL